MAKNTLPFPKRVTDAVDKIGAGNGTRIPDPTLPGDLTGDNEGTVAFIDKHGAVREFLVANILKKHTEKRYEAAKKKLFTVIPALATITPGDDKSYVFDNVTINARAQNGRTMIDRQKLVSKLMIDQKMTLDQASAFVEAVSSTSAPAIYLTPATVAE